MYNIYEILITMSSIKIRRKEFVKQFKRYIVTLYSPIRHIGYYNFP